MEDYKEFSREQVSAIRQSIKLGRTLKEDHPEIAVIYGYYSQTDIPIMLDIQSEYGVGDNVAVNGVRCAINGHEGSFGIEGYVGLITDEEELKRLREGHKVQGGQTTYEEGLGIHGRSAEQMSEDGQKGYENGLANRTAEQKSEDTRKGIISKGQTPWSDEEKEFAYMLSLESEYQHPKGPHRGKLDSELITLELNIQYHDCKEVRSNRAVCRQLSDYRKSLDDMVA
jgi:transposase-like protein